jgi:hypothetical protein
MIVGTVHAPFQTLTQFTQPSNVVARGGHSHITFASIRPIMTPTVMHSAP